MGRRDFRHREAKKPKKDTRKVPPATVLPPSTVVEVVKKVKKEHKEEE